MDDRKVTTLSEPTPEPKPSPTQQRQMELYQAAFDHVTTNRHQRRAREGLAKKAAAARKRAKKARHGK